MIDGIVRKISADSAQLDTKQEKRGEVADVGPSSYKAIVQLDRQTLGKGDAARLLPPGMQVAAEIHDGHRTVLEYLLSPVRKVAHDAARKR